MFYFDNRPMIVKPWNQEMDLGTESITSLPIWVRFMELDIKYWGMASLSKLGSMLGIPIKMDRYTMDKTRLSFARLLIDIPMDSKFPEHLDFVNDNDVVVRLQVDYEWKPTKCDHCHMFGHKEDDCRKKTKAKRVWREVQTQTATREEVSSGNQDINGQVTHTHEVTHQSEQVADGFIPVNRPTHRRSMSPSRETAMLGIKNPFELLLESNGGSTIPEVAPLNGQGL